MKRRTAKRLTAAMFAFVLTAQTVLMAWAGADGEEKTAMVTVSAQSSVTVTPDLAEITLRVTGEAETADGAQKQNAEKLNAAVEVLKTLGVEEKDIQTTGYEMYPNYSYESYQKIVGYIASASLKISNQKVEDAGTLISACVSQGINGIEGVRFSCSGYQEAYQEALMKAVEQASLTAKALAEASGKSLGEIYEIKEGYQDTTYRNDTGLYVEEALDVAEAKSFDTGARANVMPGEAKITASVTASWYLE